ncbi:hypothetical protein FWH13_02750 [Candidatus Saccharibacteria bacterium]|nr:hypothetical protein [Candidatus Saccharibacteria bacterium]
MELLQNSQKQPSLKPNPNGRHEIVYRFAGRTRSGETFFVQVKEDKNGAKHFISVFDQQ